MTESLLLLPGQPGFYEILATPPPDPSRRVNFIARVGGSGILEAVEERDLDEYLEGGEYDERLEEIGEDETVSESLLLLPDSISVNIQCF